jgi:hypothetical protein
MESYNEKEDVILFAVRERALHWKRLSLPILGHPAWPE